MTPSEPAASGIVGRSQPAVLAPSIGLVIGAVLIVMGTVGSVLESIVPLPYAAAFAALGLAFLAPLVGRWPVTRRRCAWIAVGWFTVGSLLALPLAIIACLVPAAAALAAVPALIGAAVGWD